jgi:hypothetical protein
MTHARANPGKLNCAKTASGSANHLASEVLNINDSLRTLMVPCKGPGPTLTDLLVGHVHMLFARPRDVRSHATRALINRISGDVARVIAARDIRDKIDAQSSPPSFQRHGRWLPW